MALKGTLKDFGIADIFQLIGHQSKSGVLLLKNGEQDVRITFKEGNVIKAESTSRDKKDLLGNMLVRSEVLTPQQLDVTLDTQRRTMRRMGDILVETGFVGPAVLREFMKLQTNETIYKLFHWKNGTYEFTQAEPATIDAEGVEAIRSESVLMEGFRMVDEWPLIRRKIMSYAMTFRVLKTPPLVVAKKKEADHGKKDTDFLDGIDDAFGAMEAGAEPKKEDDGEQVGGNERLIFGLVQPGRDVQKLIDLSRLGEFETCKSLLNLVDGGYLEPISAAQTQGSGIAEGGALEPPKARTIRVNRLGQAAGYLVGVLLVLVAVWGLGLDPASLMRSDRIRGLGSDDARLQLGRMTEERLERALEVYRLQKGAYPDNLEALMDAGLLTAWELRQPYERPFSYARVGQGYRLIRPFF